VSVVGVKVSIVQHDNIDALLFVTQICNTYTVAKEMTAQELVQCC